MGGGVCRYEIWKVWLPKRSAFFCLFVCLFFVSFFVVVVVCCCCFVCFDQEMTTFALLYKAQLVGLTYGTVLRELYESESDRDTDKRSNTGPIGGQTLSRDTHHVFLRGCGLLPTLWARKRFTSCFLLVQQGVNGGV